MKAFTTSLHSQSENKKEETRVSFYNKRNIK